MKKNDSVMACPRCHAKECNPPYSFLSLSETNPNIAICPKCGEMPVSEALTGPRIRFVRYEMP